MGRTPCCDKTGLKKGKWTEEEDEKLINYIKANGEGCWRSLPKNAGLLRCGKSCRLRWINYLRTDLKRGNFTVEEEETIVKLHNSLGNRWSLIASHLPGRTDNEIKNYWNSHLRREIYRFRSIGDSTLSAADMIKMVSGKKREGRVSRAVTNKYNANTNSNSSSSRVRIAENGSSAVVQKHTTAEEPSGSDCNLPNANIEGDTDMDRLDTIERKDKERDASIDGSFCTEEWHNNAFMLSSPNDVRETEMWRSLMEIDDEILMHLNHFLEGETTNQCEHVRENIVNTNSATTSEERAVFWSSNLETRDMHACSSPVVSYFNDEVIHLGEEFNLWSEEEDILIW